MKARMAFIGVLVAFLSATPLGSWADNLGQKADTKGSSPRRVLLGDAWPGTERNYQETDTNGHSPRRVLLGDAWPVTAAAAESMSSR